MSTTLVVLGPTASGKSDVAMAFAERHADVEIVAADAMQVYRRMDIGTAKPTLAEQAVVRHHGIDLTEPSADYSVGDFARSAGAALVDIADRGRRALLVGGTGLYLRSLTDPMEMPGRWPEVRAALEAREVATGSAALHAELAHLDPLAASRMEPTNARRIVRALEVVLGSGRPFSSFGPGMEMYPPIEFVQIGLRWQRERLTLRIAERVHRMVERGLVAEVESLLSEPAELSRTARQALGYKELIEHLEGRCSLDAAIATVILRTRQFAVRQERWFRRDPRIRWVDVTTDPVAEVLPVLEE
ncbi:MAG: tRNA (adenosine(37)-N6)-dimethylallyltransferase MiaA [Actinobacteria bacterium]|nr:tRNA (adenosine(37)-N6)-dimethylallyltransferase MiaA [Actinomycetota bacterium]MSX92820.1 tRNA (adenosine(37)-N6)-dimethylallyltransferase MiaA [Actinomycetota bacterium]MSZ81799.1 tRNA (adenosine(37)-N6)-dimethylallyltransferase MiaA [Actinomycetota bacterium]MTB16638.1 tRNA (adenosine(37)-N6)-dimethylallyltransferase MiaA [Actinomycetota bacterium]